MTAKRNLRLGVLAVVTALLAACGSDEPSGDEAGQSAAAGEPQAGGTLQIIQLTEPRTLDPALMGNQIAGNTLVGNSLYGQLMSVDEGGELEYGLAEDLSSSDGGTTWQLTLREGLTFSDGTPLDAAAVEANWARIQDPSTGSTSRTAASFVQSMAASGRTLEFTLAVPIVQFGGAVANESLNWIASPQALEAGQQAFDANPIGAGPFVLDSWQRNGEMVLVRNENYFDEPRPYLDRLVLTANPDASQRFSTLQAGGTDAILSSDIDLVARAEEEGLSAASQQLGGGLALVLNTRIAPFDDARARRAVAHAVDRDVVNEVVYQGYGNVPDTFFGDDSEFDGDVALPAYDREAAQELFDELAAEGKPVEFGIIAYQTTASRRTAEAFQAQLNQYEGVDVELQVLDFPAAAAASAERSFQALLGGISFTDPAPLVYQSLFSQSSANLSGIDDPELDQALLDGLAATDEQSRTEAYQRLADRYRELVPNIHYIRYRSSMVHADHVHGVELYGTQSVRTDTLWIEE